MNGLLILKSNIFLIFAWFRNNPMQPIAHNGFNCFMIITVMKMMAYKFFFFFNLANYTQHSKNTRWNSKPTIPSNKEQDVMRNWILDHFIRVSMKASFRCWSKSSSSLETWSLLSLQMHWNKQGEATCPAFLLLPIPQIFQPKRSFLPVSGKAPSSPKNKSQSSHALLLYKNTIYLDCLQLASQAQLGFLDHHMDLWPV